MFALNHTIGAANTALRLVSFHRQQVEIARTGDPDNVAR